MSKLRFILAALCCLAWLAGCGGGQYGLGKKLLDQGRYGVAETALEAALEKEPENVRILVDLAEALYQQDRLDKAMGYLERARSLEPDDTGAVLILGLIHEKRGEIQAAIDAYRSYAKLSRLSRSRKIIKARLDRLIREQIKRQIEAALAQEASLDVASIPDNTIAVAPFRNIGDKESLDPLQKGLAEMMITDLSKVEALQVVERVRMQEMLKEIRLGETGLMDESTTPRLGKLLGASRIVSGSFADLAEEQLRLDISVAGVKTGEVEASEVRGSLDRLFRLQKELTFSLVEEMGIELTNEQRDAIQEIPTENMLAFIAYSKGLDLEDQGKSSEAAAAYQEAMTLDPQFEEVQENMERVEGAAVGTGSLSGVEAEVLPKKEEVETEETADGAEGESETLGRLSATGANTGAGFMPTDESTTDLRKAVEEAEDSGPATTQVRVEVSIP
jgi:tetratricopeptide (TPR) repeat protein